MLFIFSEKLTSRVTYIVDFIFTDVLQIKYTITNNTEEFLNHSGAKINYSTRDFQNTLSIFPSTLLFEEDVSITTIERIKDNPSAFPFPTKNSILKFDLFASCFYLITRYEEYDPNAEKDQHNRYLAKNCWQYKSLLLKTPIVNKWIKELQKVLLNTYPQLDFPETRFKQIISIDIDNLFAYKHKPLYKKIGALAKKLFTKEFTNHLRILIGSEKDPYDSYDYIIKTAKENPGIDFHIFFLIGNYGGYDRNISSRKAIYKNIVKKLSKIGDIGIHPSYKSNTKTHLVKKEKKILEKIINKEIISNRQHYLKLTLPNTYQNLIANQISKDFSLAFAECNGYRGGTCTPFTFFDLTKNESTSLKVFPSVFMDATCKYHLKLSPEQAIKELNALLETTKEFNGTFISIWHNESITDKDLWNGWQKVFSSQL